MGNLKSVRAGAERLLLAVSLSSSRQKKRRSVVLVAVGRRRIGSCGSG